MTVNYTTNLALGQPVTGTESGTWGDDVNNSVTSYLDIAIAGGLAITVTTTDVTLTLTQGTSSATNIGSTTAQYAILNVSGAMTAARNLILPSSSRQYVINNNTTGGFALTVKGSATSGVTMVNGEKAHVFWNGSDYAKLSNTPGGAGTFSSITNTGLTSGRVVYSTTGGLETDSANLTFDGTNLGLAGGTANGVAYLNGSKVLTTGSALSFSGSTFALQTAAGTSAVMNLTSGSNATQTKFNIGQTGSVDWDVGISVTAGDFYIGGLGGTVAQAYKIVRTGTSIDYQTWNTGGSERMRIDSSGNVVIGQSTATNKFNVVSSDSTSAVGSSTASICITNTYTGAYGYSSDLIYRLGGGAGTRLAGISGIYTAGGGELALYTYNGTTFAEKMRIDSSGNVGIGTSSPSTYGKFVVSGSSNAGVGTFIGNASLTGSAPTYQGSIRLIDNPTSSTAASGGIEFLTSTFGSGYGWKMAAIDSSGVQLTFATRQNSAAWTEAMRLDTSGNLLVGTTTSGGKFTLTGGGQTSYFTQSTSGGYVNSMSAASNAGTFYYINFLEGATSRGAVTSNGVVMLYGGTSDYRLKTVIGAVSGSGNRIDALQPVEYTWNINGERTRGFLAHQFQEVYAGSVSGTKDAVDNNGKPVYQSMQAGTSEVIADLVAEIQSLRKRLTALEST